MRNTAAPATAAIALAAIAAAFVLGAAPAGGDPLPIPVPGQASAAVAVAPESAPAGATVTVDGSAHPSLCGVPALLIVTVHFDGAPVGTALAGPDGAFATTFTVPADAAAGPHTVATACAVIGLPMATLASTELVVLPPIAELTDRSLPPGTTASAATPLAPDADAAVEANDEEPAGVPPAVAVVASVASPPTTTVSSTTFTSTTVTPTTPATRPSSSQRLESVATTSSTPGAGRAEVDTDRSALAATLPSISELATDLGTIGSNLLGALLLLLLLGLPAELVNEAMETQVVTENRSWLRRTLARAELPVAGPRGIALFAALAVGAAIVNGFLDPSFGIDRGSVAQTLGLAVAFMIVTVVWEVPGVLYLRSRAGERRALEILPLGLAIAAASVLFCRLADLQPGYAFGILAAVPTLSGQAGRAASGRACAIDAGAMAALAAAAYLVWSRVDSVVETTGDSAPLLLLALDAGLVGIVLAALSCLTFSLAPLAFLKGAELFGWSRAAWAGFLGLGLFGMLHLVVHPGGGFATVTPQTFAQLLPFALVAVAALAYWAYVRHLRSSDLSVVAPQG